MSPIGVINCSPMAGMSQFSMNLKTHGRFCRMA